MNRLLVILVVCLFATFAVGLTQLAALLSLTLAGYGAWLAHTHEWRPEARRMRQALAAAGFTTPAGHPPGIGIIEASPRGLDVHVPIPSGRSVNDLARLAPTLASALAVPAVRVVGNPHNARWAIVKTLLRDPLAASEAWASPLADAPAGQPYLWGAIPLGVDENGRAVTARLVDKNLLLGGLPGQGKSNGLQLVTAAGALSPRSSCRLHLLDGKGGTELHFWRDCAEHFATTPKDAVTVLKSLQAEVGRRQVLLLEEGKRKVTDLATPPPLDLLVIDELAVFTDGASREEAKAFNALLGELVRLGRATGLIVVAATQKPSADVVPSSLRDNFAWRWAFGVATPQASDTILGDGAASRGFSAHLLPDSPGLSLLATEGRGEPMRMRADLLTDDAIRAIVERAEHVPVGAHLHLVAEPAA